MQRPFHVCVCVSESDKEQGADTMTHGQSKSLGNYTSSPVLCVCVCMYEGIHSIMINTQWMAGVMLGQEREREREREIYNYTTPQ